MFREAVLILGYQNNGKTSTIRHLIGVKKLYNRIHTIQNNKEVYL